MQRDPVSLAAAVLVSLGISAVYLYPRLGEAFLPGRKPDASFVRARQDLARQVIAGRLSLRAAAARLRANHMPVLQALMEEADWDKGWSENEWLCLAVLDAVKAELRERGQAPDTVADALAADLTKEIRRTGTVALPEPLGRQPPSAE